MFLPSIFHAAISPTDRMVFPDPPRKAANHPVRTAAKAICAAYVGFSRRARLARIWQIFVQNAHPPYQQHAPPPNCPGPNILVISRPSRVDTGHLACLSLRRARQTGRLRPASTCLFKSVFVAPQRIVLAHGRVSWIPASNDEMTTEWRT